MSGSLKAFEKWDKQVKVKTWSGNIMEVKERKWYREQTWKAALEWVLSNFDGKTDMLDLGLTITNELQEE